MDDLVALAVATNSSPLELLFGIDGTGDGRTGVEATGIPDWLLREEVWSWAAGDTTLDREGLVELWQEKIDDANDRIAFYEELRNSAVERSLEEDRSSAQRRDRFIREARQRLQFAVERLAQLSDESAGVIFEELPADPLALILPPEPEDPDVEHQEAP